MSERIDLDECEAIAKIAYVPQDMTLQLIARCRELEATASAQQDEREALTNRHRADVLERIAESGKLDDQSRGWLMDIASSLRAARKVQADAGAVAELTKQRDEARRQRGEWQDIAAKFESELVELRAAHPFPAGESAEASEITEETAMRVSHAIIANLKDRAGVLDDIDDETMSEIADDIAVTITTELQGGV